MVNVLADLAIESEAATAVALRLARAYDEAPADPGADAFKRLATAVAKYYVCKRAPRPRFRGAGVPGRQRLRRGVGDAAPVSRGPAGLDLGGLGQRHGPRRPARAGPQPRGARRVLRRGRRGRRAATRGWMPSPRATRAEFTDLEAIEPRARRVVERMALCLQGSLLVRHAPPAVADAFCAARLAGDAGLHYGTLPPGVDAAAIVARHTPPV